MPNYTKSLSFNPYYGHWEMARFGHTTLECQGNLLGSPKREQTPRGQVKRCCRRQSSPNRQSPDWPTHQRNVDRVNVQLDAHCRYSLHVSQLRPKVLPSKAGVSIPSLDSLTVVSCHRKNHKVTVLFHIWVLLEQEFCFEIATAFTVSGGKEDELPIGVNQR